MFKSSVSFVFALAVLAFVAGFAVTVKDGNEPSESEKLDTANEAISDLAVQNEALRDKIHFVADQLEILTDRQKHVAESDQDRRETFEKFAAARRSQLSEIEEGHAEVAGQLERLVDGQKQYAERTGEKLGVLAERFDFGDARIREIADAQEDFAALGEKIRNSPGFKKVATVDLGSVGKALSGRIELAMKSRRALSGEQKETLNRLKQRRAQLKRLTSEQERRSNAPRKKAPDEAEQDSSTDYRAEIARLEREIDELEVEPTVSTNDNHRALQLILARAGEEYAVVFTYEESEDSVMDLTSRVTRMIRQLPDDDPILSDR